jgi:hypothetical protein
MVECDRRDASIVKILGDYAKTETRQGPNIQFAGALNAVVVVKTGKGISGPKTIAAIDAGRRANFDHKWPLKNPGVRAVPDYAAADIERGYALLLPNSLHPAKQEIGCPALINRSR